MSAECGHVDVMRFSSADGAARLWSCTDCGRRFYPACPTCVTVGHRNEVHEAPRETAAPAGLDPSVEAIQLLIDGAMLAGPDGSRNFDQRTWRDRAVAFVTGLVGLAAAGQSEEAGE